MSNKWALILIWLGVGLICQYFIIIRKRKRVTLADVIITLLTSVVGPLGMLVYLFGAIIDRTDRVVLYEKKGDIDIDGS